MRTLSAAFRAALMAERTGEVAAVLVTVRHPDLPQPLRISSDPTTCLELDPYRLGTVSRGLEFEYLAFEITLPEDQESTPPAIELRLDNTSRELVQLIQSTSTAALVDVEIISASRPDLVEVVFPVFEVSSGEYDEEVATIGLQVEGLTTEPFPTDSFTPTFFRGLF